MSIERRQGRGPETIDIFQGGAWASPARQIGLGALSLLGDPHRREPSGGPCGLNPHPFSPDGASRAGWSVAL